MFIVTEYAALSLVFVMLSRLFFAALWSPAGKGLTSWLSFVMFNCFLSLSHKISSVGCDIYVSISDLCNLFYFH